MIEFKLFERTVRVEQNGQKSEIMVESGKKRVKLKVKDVLRVFREIRNPIIITRHKVLLDEMRSQFPTCEVIEHRHAIKQDVKGRVVFGVLPPILMAECELFVSVNFTLPSDAKWKEFTREELMSAFRGVAFYRTEVASV